MPLSRSPRSCPQSQPLSANNAEPVSQPYLQAPPQPQRPSSLVSPYTTPPTVSHLSSNFGSQNIASSSVQAYFADFQISLHEPLTHSHNTLRSHESRMTRSQIRRCSPKPCHTSPPTLGEKASTGLLFNERMARQVAHRTPTPAVTTKQRTFLHDISDSSFDGDNSDTAHIHDDGGHVARSITPVTALHVPAAAAATAAPTLLADLVPPPLFFQDKTTLPSPQSNASEPANDHSTAALCDHRRCLKLKDACFEHVPTQCMDVHRSRQERYRHRTRREMSGTYETDVWMQIAPEYGPDL